jgi:hypothetical protein
LDRKREEAGQVGYIIENELGDDMIDLVDIEVRIRDALFKAGFNIDNISQD